MVRHEAYVIFDCFIFNDEERMLSLRLHELDQYVDYFVIVEGLFTFQGKPKPLTLPELYVYKQFRHKIIPLVNIELKDSPWENEYHSREQFWSIIRNINDDDLVLLSDVDEIPDLTGNAIHESGKPFCFHHNSYYYNFNCRALEKIPGLVGMYKYQLPMTIREARDDRFNYHPIGESSFREGGWHLSYYGGAQRIARKLEQFAHSELNTPEQKDIAHLQSAIDNCEDFIIGRGMPFKSVHETYLPENVNKLYDLHI